MEECELYKLLKFLLNIDISFIIKDILGPNFEDIDIPSNIDEEDCTLEVNTLNGVFTIHYLNYKKELKFIHYINDTYYEEYYLDLKTLGENFLQLKGKTVEYREKGLIITNIDKNYLHKDNKIIDLLEINKVMRVYPLGEDLKDQKTLPQKSLATIGSIYNDYYEHYVNSIYEKQITISYYPSRYSNLDCPFISIDGNANYFGCLRNKNNIISKLYDLFEGKVTEENYEIANILFKEDSFFFVFSHFDLQDNDKSINETIDELIGPSQTNYKREYANYIKKIIKEYCDYLDEGYFSHETIKWRMKRLNSNTVINHILNDISFDK